MEQIRRQEGNSGLLANFITHSNFFVRMAVKLLLPLPFQRFSHYL